MKLAALTAVASAAILLTDAAACAQVVGTYRVRVGLGAQVEPAYPGADSTDIGIYPKFSVAKDDKPFSLGAPDDSLSIALVSSKGFSAGPVLAITSGRDPDEVGAPVGEVGRTVEVGAFAQHFLSDSFRIRAQARKGFGGHKGLVGSVGADYLARDADKWTVSIGPRLRFGDDKYMNAFFGVSPQAALAANIPTYDPGGGVRAVGAVTGFTYSLGGALGLFGYGRYDRLVGDAADSPIVRNYGSRDQFSAGLGLSYVFNLKI